ncbi:polyamine aminopropyltransferase [Curvibacter sp. RS43]|uniref:polyamine aminopropyltransferase n=1 Tax=Curvibacter microcysteis TaxID=3026419 RepID=UPI00236044BD|nr:polyamine aminopropyltransferase [Curvibacter sp. RS43]MDD0811026.1 polyamine aminopropyltransferase [Curvibacter sp. RS43]
MSPRDPGDHPTPTGRRPRPVELALLTSVFVVAACGLLYELAAGTLASYLLGDSVLQFSTIIGTYLFAMGLGSWASRYLERQLSAHFLRIELLVALLGGTLPAVLFLTSAYLPGAFRVVLYLMVGGVGTLVGLEIPLVMRILKRDVQLKELVAQVLTFDYLGALVVSLAFPLVLVPYLGLVRTGLLFGLMNAAVACWALWLFRHELRRLRAHALACAGVLGVLLAGMAGANHITTLAEDRFYQDRVVYTASSPYQRIVVTSGVQGHRLFLNGNLQFAERDEYRYHEALVHPVMSAQGRPQRVAILGGGDGMALREVLKYASVQQVTLVDLDPAITELFSTQPALLKLNGNALKDPRVRVVNEDAFQWLQKTADSFDVILVDFPDPTNFALGKLYTQSFYGLLDLRLSASGYAVVQTTSPLVARQSFWTVVRTLEAAGLSATPYHANVPSFGEWGFVVASRRPWRLPTTLPPGLRFLNTATLPLLFDFPQDMGPVPASVNRLSNQILVHTYEQEWGKVSH